MAGGVGTRFWPMSRKAKPKQLLNIVGSKSMLKLTYERVRSLTNVDKIIIITSKEQKPTIEKQLPLIPKENIIAEPIGRNTAICIGLACAIIKAREQEDQVMVVLPSDHLVSNGKKFRETIKLGVEFLKEHDCLITIGIQPKYPETGYGYIQANKVLFEKKGQQICQVKTFAEKPNLGTAERFLKSGDFFWNSGMFIWPVKGIMKEFEEYLPELAEDLIRIQKVVGKQRFNSVVSDVYSRTRSISIDYGVMERAKNVCMIKADFDWNDLGSWEAVYNISPKDKNGNVINSKNNILINSNKNYIYSQKKLVAAVDVEGLVVVDMEDAILICTRENSQNVKSVVEFLSRKELKSYL
jgi:mannose-1-phosphate guanylyltransferase